MKVYFEYSPLWIAVAIVVAAALAFFLYHKDKTYADVGRAKRLIMSILRFAFVFLILILLLKPICKRRTTHVQKPLIVVAQDNSMSLLLNNDSSFYRNGYVAGLDSLVDALSRDYDVRRLRFAETVDTDTAIDFGGTMSNLSAVFPDIVSRYGGMNLGALIIATDGIYNCGSNPEYAYHDKYPVFAIALGDTVSQKDLIIKNITHNKVAFLGNNFPIKIDIKAKKCSEKNCELRILNGGETVLTRQVDPTNAATLDIELTAQKIGMQHYKVELTHLDNEITYENNHADFIVNVIDNRNKILLLADAPHPDIGALKSALDDNPDFQIDIRYADRVNDDIDISDYNLLIFHNLPSKRNKATKVFTAVQKHGLPLLFFVGTQTSLPAFNALQTGVDIVKRSNNMEDAVPYKNSDFTAFDIGDNSMFFNNLSPLRTFFGDYRFSAAAKTLLSQKINGVKTDKPLVTFVDNNNVKMAFVFGEGLWHWRLDDYKANSDHNDFNMLINRMIQYMMTARMQDKLTVETKQIFSDNEPVVFNAWFYNELYEPVPHLGIKLTITDEENKDFEYNFVDSENGYRLDAGKLQSGVYQYVATTTFDGREYSEAGSFVVKKSNIELVNTTANHALLHKLAQTTGGTVVGPHSMSRLVDDIKQNTNIAAVAYQTEKLYTAADLWWLFAIIVAMAAAEWILRKYFGGY